MNCWICKHLFWYVLIKKLLQCYFRQIIIAIYYFDICKSTGLFLESTKETVNGTIQTLMNVSYEGSSGWGGLTTTSRRACPGTGGHSRTDTSLVS